MHTGHREPICYITTEQSRIVLCIQSMSKKQIESRRLRKQHVYRQQTPERDSGMGMHGLVPDRQQNQAKSRSACWWCLPCMKGQQTKNRSRFIIGRHAHLEHA